MFNLEWIVKQCPKTIYLVLALKLVPDLMSDMLQLVVTKQKRDQETLNIRATYWPSHDKLKHIGHQIDNRQSTVFKSKSIDHMQHPNTLELSRSALLIIDMQEAFRYNIKDFDKYARRIATVTRGAQLLNVPIVVTEQYPKGLGHTADEIVEVLPEGSEIIEKTAFSSCGAQACEAKLQSLKAQHILVAGIEAHICVNQTVHDLLAMNFRVHLLTDCITSRSKNDRKTAFAKMQQNGAINSSVEMALFELMRDAKHEQFKGIQGLIK